MSASAWARVSGAMAVPFVAALVVAVALNWGTPDDQSSDQKILDYYGSHSHRVRDITMFFVVVVGLILLTWFLGHLYGVLNAAAGDGGRAARIAAISGGLFIALLTVVFCVVVAFSVAISDAGDTFTLDPNTFRLLDTVGLLVLVAAFMLAAPLAFAVGIVAWRTGFLPRWLAVLSFLGGLGGLLSVSFFTMLVYLAWLLVLSIYLALRPVGASQASSLPPSSAVAMSP